MGTAGAWELAAGTPAVSLALAHTGGWLALAVWMAGTALTAVGAPVLARAAGAALGPEESRRAATQAWLHAYLAFPAGIRPLADGDGAFVILLPPAWAALELRGAAAHTDVLPTGVQRGALGSPGPEQQQ